MFPPRGAAPKRLRVDVFFFFQSVFGGFEDVEMRGRALINLAHAEEITAPRESLLGGLPSASAGTLYEASEVH